MSSNIPDNYYLDNTKQSYKDEAIELKLKLQLDETLVLLNEIRKDIQLTPLIFTLIQFLFTLILLVFLLFITFSRREVLIRYIAIPENISLFLALLSAIWCYNSYYSLRYAYTKYRKARQKKLKVLAIQQKVEKLLHTLYVKTRKKSFLAQTLAARESAEIANKIFKKNIK